MIIAAFDFETSSLDLNQARVNEVGVLLYTTTHKRVVMAESFIVDNEEAIPQESTKITHITTKMASTFGLLPKDALSRLQNYFDMAEMIAGKNIVDYDIPVYKNWCQREHEEPIDKPLIDIETDLPGVENKKLAYMCADAGFLNPFPHAALADAWSTLRLIELQPSFDEIVARSQSPRVWLQALVDFDNNYLAKEKKFFWVPAPHKAWCKIVKESDVEQFVKECQFNVKRIQPLPRG
jgi:DNA polymerase III epsilon subunit-like protein